MDPYAFNPPSGWFDLQVNPERRPAPTPPQRLFPPERQPAAGLSQQEETSSSASLQEYLKTLVFRVENRPSTDAPLRPTELAELTLQASRDEKDLWNVDVDTLTSIAGYLYDHVIAAASLSVIKEAARSFAEKVAPSQAMAALLEWTKTKGNARAESLRRGLEAASILLHLAAAPEVDNRVVHEDALQAIVELFRMHLTQHIIPSWNQTGHEPPAENGLPSSPKRRRRSSPSSTPTGITSTTASKEWKKVYQLLLPTIPTFLILMERLQSAFFTAKVSLDDQPLLMVTNAATASLEMDCAPSTAHSNNSYSNTSLGVPATWGALIQTASLDLITAAFRKSPQNRFAILEDLFGILLKLPTGKRSSRAFQVRYSSALTPQALARRNAQWVGPLLAKTCPLDSDRPHRVQMVTALIVQILQSLVVRPVYEQDEENPSSRPHLRSGLGQCHTVADYVARALLVRCSRKDVSGGASEFRPILSNLVDDLLVLLLVPEYPASEVMLLAIVNRLNQDLHGVREHKAKLEATYLNLAFDVLGKVLSVQARLRALHKERPIYMKCCHSPIESQDELKFNCYCGWNHEKVVSIRCDDCKLTWHGSCVGTNNEQLGNEWICDYCRLGRIAMREKQKLGTNPNASAVVDDVYAMRQSFIATLSHREGVIGLEPAVSFHMARWADELDAKHGKTTPAVARFVVNGILDSWESHFADTHTGESLTEEGGIRVILALLNQSSMLLQEDSFRNQVGFLVDLTRDRDHPSIRRQAVKAIERMAEGDHRLMTFKIIKDAVSNRLLDDTISVREVALSLVGSYVVQFPAVTKAYHPALLKCLSDDGVSVRKRAVKIFLEILTANPLYKSRAEVFCLLLERASDKKEEDVVRELIHEALVRLWMQKVELEIAPPKKSPVSSPASSVRSRGAPHSPLSELDTPGMVTPTSNPVEPLPPRRRADVVAQQMIEVVQTGGIDDLETVLKRLLVSTDGETLRGARDIDEKRSQHKVEISQCSQLVKALFERLLSIEEEREALGPRIGGYLAAILNTISVFGEVSPVSVYQKLAVVLPYLKADNGVERKHENSIVAAACVILCRASSVFERADIENLAATSIAKDLQQIVYKLSGAPIPAAVQAFSALAHHHQAGESDIFAKKLLSLGRTFFAYLLKKLSEKDEFSKQSEKAKGNKQRALTVLGLICQYHTRVDAPVDVESDDDDEKGGLDCPDVTDGEQLTWKNLNHACFNLFADYFAMRDPETKRVALRALGGVFMTEPRLMLDMERDGFLKEILDPKAGSELQLEAMVSWKEILNAEEKRIDGGHAKKMMDQNKTITVSKRIAGDQDGDSNIFGGILTSYAESIYRLTKVSDKGVRFAACELLEVMMRQGLVNPNDAVPHLFALQGDVDHPAIRELACTLLMAEGEKRPDTLRLRIRDGVRLAYEFQRKIRGGGQVSALLPYQKQLVSIFDIVYRECVSRNKKQRQGLFKNLLGLFELRDLASQDSPSKKGRKKQPTFDVSMLGFTAEILAYLPYTSSIDPLFIIHHISSIVTIQGEQVIDRLADCLRPVGLSSADIYDDRNVAEDALERAAKSKFPSKTSEAVSLRDDKLDFPVFTRLCQAAVTMTLLLRLKRYLRQVYGLTEARCVAYDPNEKEKVSDKGVNRSDAKIRFDAAAIVTTDVDVLIQQYATFRVLMREENTLATAAKRQESDLEDDDEADYSRKRKF